MLDGRGNLAGFETICVSTIGSSHIKSGLPCEDYGLVRMENGAAVFAVADGHGDANCPRSSFGSQKACEIACSELLTFAHEAREATYLNKANECLSWESRLFDSGFSETTVRQISSSIVGNWRDAVLEDLENNPLTEAERLGSSGYIDRYDKGERLEHIYGTTLIAGLLTERYLLLLQQGDGRCLLFSLDGTESQPIPWDDACFANVTTSLCDEDAATAFRYYVQDLSQAPIAACMAGTDGVEDSFFSMDQVHAYYRGILLDAAESSVNECERHLIESLPDFTAHGSGDDVTICGFVDPSAMKSLAHMFEKRNADDDVKSELSRVEDRLRSMSGKLEHLRAKLEEAEQRESNAAKNAREAWGERERCQRDSDIIGAGKVSLLKNLSVRFQEWLFNGVEAQLNESENQLQETQRVLCEATEDCGIARQEYETYLAAYESNVWRRDELAAKLSADRGEQVRACNGLEETTKNLEAISEQADAPSGTTLHEERKTNQQ